MRTIISIVMLILVSCSMAGSSKYKEIPHRADLKKSLDKCTPWHVKMHGKDFDYKRKFCYAWKQLDKKGKVEKDKNGYPIWHVKTFDVIDDHDFFVNRGIWQSSL